MLLLHFGSFLCWKGKLVKTCCHWISVQRLYNLASFNLISPFPLRILKNGFLTAAPPVRPFLMRLKPTANRWINWRASCISSLMSGLCWISYFLKDMTVRHSICFFFFFFFKKPVMSSFVLHLFSFHFDDTLPPLPPKKSKKHIILHQCIIHSTKVPKCKFWIVSSMSSYVQRRNVWWLKTFAHYCSYI